MHDSVREFVYDVIDAQRETLAGCRVLEMGSLNVNGSVRDLFAEVAHGYLGIDGQLGPGVDLQCFSWGTPFRDETFDVVVSTEMLEHDAKPALTFKEANRVLPKGGHLIVTARGPGFPEHDYPDDHWRFTPEDLSRLATFAGFAVIRAVEDHHVPGAFLHAMKTGGPQLDALLALRFTPMA